MTGVEISALSPDSDDNSFINPIDYAFGYDSRSRERINPINSSKERV